MLLETGSSQYVRNTAATQLADIQKNHPDELFNLLTRVVPFIKAKNWETRTAAVKALGGIIENAEKFNSNLEDDTSMEFDEDVKVKAEDATFKREDTDTDLAAAAYQLRLETLDCAAIVTNGKKLVKEYDYHLASMDPLQRLSHQKKSLTARLGLGGQYIEEDLIDERDVQNTTTVFSPKPGMHRLNTSIERQDSSGSAIETATTPLDDGQADENAMSRRQLNILKRKNKRDLKNSTNKVRIVDLAQREPSFAESRPLITPVTHTIKKENSLQDNGTETKPDYLDLERKGPDDDTKLVNNFKGIATPGKSELRPEEEEEAAEWPFERLCEYLQVDLFDCSWEIRHGAAMGLREIVRVHGGSAGRRRDRSKAVNDQLNQQWLDDLACRICCVFMLDRFGDFFADNVVAPIREAAGQTLGATLSHMDVTRVKAVYHILNELVLQPLPGFVQPIWEACHGAMIGLRYLVAVRSDVLLADKTVMTGVLETVVKGLQDRDDDIRAVSAATLIPVCQELVVLPHESLSKLITIIWDCLIDLSDDLSASTGSVMDLLAKLCGFPEVFDIMKSNADDNQDQSFAHLVPRLYPFLRHTITGVRSAVLRALLTFLNIQGQGTKDWIDGKTLRLIFQNLLLERDEGVLRLSLTVWDALLHSAAEEGPAALTEYFEDHLHAVLTLTLHPIGLSRHPLPMDPSLLIRPSGQVFVLPTYTRAKSPPKSGGETSKRKRKAVKDLETSHAPTSQNNIDGPMIQGDIDLVGTGIITRSRILAAHALGKLINLWRPDARISHFDSYLAAAMDSPYSSSRLTCCMIIEEYAKARPQDDSFQLPCTVGLQKLTEDELPPYWTDLISHLRIVQAQCHALVNTFASVGHLGANKLPTVAAKVQGEEDSGPYAFSIKDGDKIVTKDFDRLKKALTPSQRTIASRNLDDIQSDAQRAIDEAKEIKDQRDVRIRAAAAAAAVALKIVPKKPTPTIKGLMDSVKLEENIELQRRSAAGVIALIYYLVKANRTMVVEKLVGNVVKFYCMDTAETPEFLVNANYEAGILSLKKDEDIRDHVDQAKHDLEAKKAGIQRRGAKETLDLLCTNFGEQLFEKVPILQMLIKDSLKDVFGDSLKLPDNIKDKDVQLGQRAVDGLSTLRAIINKLHPTLHQFIIEMMPFVVTALRSKLSVLRYAAAKCLATMCSVKPDAGFDVLVRQVLPSISNVHDIFQRQGATESIYHLINVMEDDILPYVVFLIVPVLGRMSDSDNDVRLLSTTAFATLVKLVPLEAGIPDPPGLSQELLAGREKERKFMAQMLDPKKVESFEIPVAIKATLRSYQQDGVNWLAFLNRYHLHGVLCDDMGLGKTLQTLCIVASDHHIRAEEYEKTQNPDMRKLPSLIVCPPTLSGHWKQEIKTYAPFLNPVAYVGPPNERNRFRKDLATADVVITSYEICRNDAEILSALNWNYCVLDEGHLIKNPAAKTTLAVKILKSNHRLILSGTPIQNNVLELWSLFDFLMPGFLGTEKVFKDRFAKPIAASRFSKSSSKEQERGALAVEALHKQVLPFLLRRLKEEVLDDLPPKIIQNYYCDLSDFQKKLFEDFSKKEGKAISDMASNEDKESKAHIFTALNYMRKLCNSPALVMKESHKQYAATQAYLAKNKTHLRDPVHAPKLTALRDLLVDCGIGASDVSTKTANGTLSAEEKETKQLSAASEAVSQHRALIFCQMKEMLDIVQNDVLQKMLPSVTYLRLDGGVEANKRQDIVNQFNGDPSIDCLLLTTSVGGLGLNLTGADTVIFVEHDWNPQKDIQAMDRAHRIGQKKVVNVYRLVTRGTLEEKILSLQRFKIDVASQVVSQQNSKGLQGMESGEILDLFSLGEGAEIDDNKAEDGEGAIDEVTGEVREKGKKGFLDDLGELWEERQYEEEYNLDEFLTKMKA